MHFPYELSRFAEVDDGDDFSFFGRPVAARSPEWSPSSPRGSSRLGEAMAGGPKVDLARLSFLDPLGARFAWEVQNYQDLSDITSLVDQRMSSSFTSVGIREFLHLIAWCLNPIGERRPLSSYLVSELDRIREKEMNLTTIRGEGTTTVIPGSQLFK